MDLRKSAVCVMLGYSSPAAAWHMEGGARGAQKSAKAHYIDHKKTVQSASHDTRHGGEGGDWCKGWIFAYKGCYFLLHKCP